MNAFVDRLFARPYLLLVLTMMMWGGNGVAGRLAVGEISPLVLTFLRWIFVCVLLVIVARRTLIADWPAVRRRWLVVTMMGLFGFTVFNALFYEAAHFTTAVNMTILQGSMPALVLLGVLAIFGTRIALLQGVGVAVTLMGIAVLASGGSIETLKALRLNYGDGMMLIACVLYAGYTIAMRSRPSASALGLFAYIAAVACLSASPLLAIEIAQGAAIWPHSLKGWLVLLYVSLFPSLLAQIFFIRAIEMIGPGRAGLFINLVPVFGALFAVVLLGEDFGLHHAIALVLVILGILLAEGRRPAPAIVIADVAAVTGNDRQRS